MNKLYNKIYEAVNNSIQKALIITDGQSGDTSVKFHNKEISTKFIPYEYRTVDLDLPTGLLWCEYNLDAFPGPAVEDWYGDYYTSDDANLKKIKDEYKIPTDNDYNELLDNTDNKWVKNYKNIQGLNGILFTGKNGNTLFFPAGGCYYKSAVTNDAICGYVWAAQNAFNTTNTDYVPCFYFDDYETARVEDGYHFNYFSVRCVQKIN